MRGEGGSFSKVYRVWLFGEILFVPVQLDGGILTASRFVAGSVGGTGGAVNFW